VISIRRPLVRGLLCGVALATAAAAQPPPLVPTPGPGAGTPVTPPPGLEAGYVPIATRHELAE
jgi:hypothetical protein